MQQIDVVVLVGGKGTRLEGADGGYPKALVKINGIPFLDIIINNLLQYDFNNIVLCVGYKANLIKKYYASNKKFSALVYSDESRQLGTGGAIKNAEIFIESDHLLVINGDTYCTTDLLKFYEFHLNKNSVASIVVTKCKNDSDGGMISLDASNKISSFKEKSNIDYSYINSGVYLFKKELLSLFPSYDSYSLEYDFFPNFIGGSFYGYATESSFMDIGTPQRLNKFREFYGKQVNS